VVVRALASTSGVCLRAQLLEMVGERPGHGYELCDRLGCAVARAGATGAGGGTCAAEAVAVYRALRAMERDGLLESQWDEPSSGPARRVYSLACA
jgi:PadR family transcriptional regulator, regulatory protein PadR